MRSAGCLDTYCPVDISEEITRETAARIAAEYGIKVRGLVCDFEFDLERVPVEGPRVIALLGGTIGNPAPHQRAGFLRRIANLLGEEDRFLLGTDLVKDRETLETAYNDPHGDGGVQQERPLRSQPGARRRLRPQRLRARRALGPENLWVDIWLRSLADQVVKAPPSTCWFRSRPARRCAPRFNQVPPPRAGGDLRRGGARAHRLVDRFGRALRAQSAVQVPESGVSSSSSSAGR